jgi:prolyl-tRNA synthetase
LKKFFTPKNSEKPEIHGGFVKAYWCEEADSLEKIADLKVTVRCRPMEDALTDRFEESEGICVLTGKKATKKFIFAKSY